MKFRKKPIYIITIILVIILIGIFIYPTLYKYDKLEQKYPVKINRLTGEADVLTTKGWVTFENIADNEVKTLKEELLDKLEVDRQELLGKLEADRQELKNDIAQEVKSQIKDEVITEIRVELIEVKTEINQYKKFELDPNNYFTIGSTKDEVKQIMGAPNSINDYYDTWQYGSSSISFKNNKVCAYHNFDNNLRVR